MTSLKFYSKPRRKRIGPEACLQMAVVQHLMLRGVPGLIYFSIPNEGKRSEAAAHYLKRMGMLPGVGDLCIIVPTPAGAVYRTPVFLELKALRGTQSTDQQAFERLCTESGAARYFMADNIDTALTILWSIGAIPRIPADPVTIPERRRAA